MNKIRAKLKTAEELTGIKDCYEFHVSGILYTKSINETAL